MIRILSATLAIIFAVLFTTPAHSMSATLKDNTPACLKEEWMKDMTSFVVTKDKASYDAYINQKKCIIMKSRLAVTVIESPWIFGGYTNFVYEGVKYWATTDSFNYDN